MKALTGGRLFKDGKLEGRKLARRPYATEEDLREYFSQSETETAGN